MSSKRKKIFVVVVFQGYLDFDIVDKDIGPKQAPQRRLEVLLERKKKKKREQNNHSSTGKGLLYLPSPGWVWGIFKNDSPRRSRNGRVTDAWKAGWHALRFMDANHL